MKLQRIMLTVAGVVNIVTSVTATRWWMAAFGATFAALCFLVVGIIWERYTPTFADSIARNVYGAQDATQLLLSGPFVLPVEAEPPDADGDG